MNFCGKGATKSDESFCLTRKETLFFSGPCSVCGERVSEPIPILGYRKGPLNQANYPAMECCGGPVCLSCSERQKAGKLSHSVKRRCLFCSEDGEEMKVVTTRQVDRNRTSIQWTVDVAEPLKEFERASLHMPYLPQFLRSMTASQRLSLKISWRTVKNQHVRDLYEGFLQRSLDLWKRFFARNLTFNPFASQCEQQLAHRFLFLNRMVKRYSWLTHKRVGPCSDVHIITKTVQRIPPGFICFCIRQMGSLGSFKNPSNEKKIFEEIFRRVLSRFFFGSGVSRVSRHPFAH